MPDILVTRRDDVGIVSLNRPEVYNAVKFAMWRELAGIRKPSATIVRCEVFPLQ